MKMSRQIALMTAMSHYMQDRAQNNGLSQVIFRPTLVYDRASPI